jgi:ribose 5-phosphate isomerase B
MKIAIGADHAGFALKESLKTSLESEGTAVEDFGTHSKDSVDYPDFGVAVARAVSEGRAHRGILICHTGIGMSIVANKVPGVRAALCRTEEDARLARRHNDANVLALSGSFTPPDLAGAITKAFLGTDFESGGRHERRVEKIRHLTGK